MKKNFKIGLLALSILMLTSCGPTETASSVSPSSEAPSSTPSQGTSKTSSTQALSGKTKFLTAKANTVDCDQYEYNYELSASLQFIGATAKVASISGNTKYKSTNPGTQYIQKNVTKTGLLFESTTYTFNDGDSIIKVNENSKKLSIAENQKISNFDYKNESFNKLINNINTECLDEGEERSGRYYLKFKPALIIHSVLDISISIDVDYFVNLINESQDYVKFDLESYVTYNGDYFKDFVFNVTATVIDDFVITISYSQSYTNVGKNVSIAKPSFEGLSVSQADVEADLNQIKNSINAFKAEASSGYDFKTKTAVDHGISRKNPFGCAVNSTSKGDTRRTHANGDLYFNNDLEVDSDYKNSDQYTKEVINDYHVYRAKVDEEGSPDPVYDRVPRTFTDDYFLAEDSNELDDFYFLFDNYLSFDYVKVASREENKSKKEITYTLGLNSDGCLKAMDDFNKAIRLNGNHDIKVENNPGHIDIYQVDGSFSTKHGEVKVVLDSETGAIKKIETYIKGYYNAVKKSVKSPGANQFVKFELESTLDKFNTDSYKIPTNKKDIDK